MHCMVKKMCVVLTAALSVITLAICALAYENEPYDFRGIKWGTPIAELLDMEPVLEGGDFKAYMRKGDELKLGDAQLSSVHYIFYKDEFYCVRIEFDGFSNFSKIKDVFFGLYGKPGGREYAEMHYVWKGDRTSITLDYDESTGRGELGYKYMPIDSKIDVDEKSRAKEDAGESIQEATSDGRSIN